MTYVISDIHNNSKKFRELLKRLDFNKDDRLYIAGDIFDRGSVPDPLGLYHSILRLGEQCVVIRGNHEQALAEYIIHYYNTPERRRKKLLPYKYNSFELLRERLTQRDMLDLAEWMLNLPLQIEARIGEAKYLIAHARTAPPDEPHPQEFYLSSPLDEEYLTNGAGGYVSVIGHRVTLNHSIWINQKRNVIRTDCGCGYCEGRLGCLCLETSEESYI